MCRFVGCGRNDRFNYVVMELQVGFLPSKSISFSTDAQLLCIIKCFATFASEGKEPGRFAQDHDSRHFLCLDYFEAGQADSRGH